MPTAADWNAAASHLAGRRTEVRFGQPYYQGAAGAAWITADGMGVVEIANGMPFADALAVMCHECAHLAAGDAPQLVNGPPKLAYNPAITAHLTTGRKAIEAAADMQAQVWVKHAQAAAQDAAGQLQALATWTEPKYQRMIDAAAQNAVKTVFSRYGLTARKDATK